MKGRKPTPIEVRARNGNPQHRPLPTPLTVGGRVSPLAIPPAPPHLTNHQADVWDATVRLLIDARLYDRADQFAVEAFAAAMGRAREIREWLNGLPPGAGRLMAETQRGGWTSNPMLAKELDAIREARMYGEVLGLNAVARTRLGLGTKERNGLGGITGNLPGPELRLVEGT